MLYDDLSSAHVAPPQNLRRMPGISPLAVCVYHLVEAMS